MRLYKSPVIALIIAMGISLAPSVLADPTPAEKAGARSAAKAGAEAFRDGKWQKAIDLFRRAESLVHAPPHLIYLARASERLGKLVESHEYYMQVVKEPLPPNAPVAFKRAQETARKEVRQVEPRLPHVVIQVEGEPEGELSVQMDGNAIPSALVGVSTPVNPGTHEIRAFTPAQRSDPVQFEVAEGGDANVVLALEALPEGEGPTPPQAQAAAENTGARGASTTSGPGEPEADSSVDAGGGGGLVIGGLVGAGVGVVGLSLGTVFGLQAKSNFDESNEICTPNCPANRRDEIEALDSDAESAQTIATVSFIVGGAGLAAGATLLTLGLTRSESSAATNEAYIRPWVGYKSAGVSGAF